MTFMDGYVEDIDANNMVIQRALREIDERDLEYILCGLAGSPAEAIRRNLSRRACEAVDREVAKLDHSVVSAQTAASREDFVRRLAKFRKYGAPGFVPGGARPAATDTPTALVAFFTALCASIRAEGPEVCAGLVESARDPVVRKGLEYLADGLDPLLVHGLLERLKESRLRQEETLLGMMVEGFDSITSGDMPGITAEKLRAFAPDAAPPVA